MADRERSTKHRRSVQSAQSGMFFFTFSFILKSTKDSSVHPLFFPYSLVHPHAHASHTYLRPLSFQTLRKSCNLLSTFDVPSSFGLVIPSEDSHKFENRSDRDDSYDYSHGSFRFAREERPPHQRYPQSDRGQRYSQHDSHRYFESEVSTT